MRIFNLSFDIITKPPPEMWKAFRSLDDSKIEDDIEGVDQTLEELEEKAAKVLGKEKTLYTLLVDYEI
ncbi:MAG: hypothetical protein ACFFEY_06405 [Candidatus Thorarchaeota archaeon]